MRHGKQTMAGAMLAIGLAVAPAARADVTGSFDGGITVKKQPQPVAVAAVFAQAGTGISGTVALPGDLAAIGGAYLVVGKATPKRLKVSGNGPGGATFKWRAKIVGDTLTGRAKVRGQGAKVAGVLAMSRNVFTSDGSSCDTVYTNNKTTFDTEVLGQALTVCTTCHAPGLQAAATRLHVTTSDPLATARAVALFVDSADPTASRILEKPQDLVPHGGGVQLLAGSPELQILQDWVTLVAQAHCN